MRKYNFNSSPIKSFFKKNGFYCALAVAVLGLAASAYAAINSTVEILTPEPEKVYSETPAQQTVSGVEADVSLVSGEEEVSSAISSKVESAEETLNYPDCFVMPVEGKVYNEYSDGEMVFNNTLEDWRAHNAVDFQAAEGSAVKAVADGIIEEIDYDERYGYIVTVDHGGGLIAKYCNLQREIFFEEDENIEMGDVIGGVGKESFMEYDDGPHLHFEMYLNGKSADPLAVLGVRE